MDNNSVQCHDCLVGLICGEAFKPNDIYCLAVLDNIKQAQTNVQQQLKAEILPMVQEATTRCVNYSRVEAIDILNAITVKLSVAR
jgi:hypothetical protein